MHVRVVLAGAIALLGIGGCAGMSEEECLTGDWHTIGFEDGSLGRTSDRLGDHRRACAKHGVAPDFEAYRAGHEEGLRDFCRPSRGFNLGARGAAYNGVCAAHQETEFVAAYNSGYHLYNLRSRVDGANGEIHARESELASTRERIRETEAALIARDTSAEERVLLVADLAELSERVGDLEAQIDLLIEERARHEEQLAAYEDMLGGAAY